MCAPIAAALFGLLIVDTLIAAITARHDHLPVP